MNKRPKKWSQMKTAELREATRHFDDPSYDPPASKPPRAQVASLRRAESKARRTRVAVALESPLVERADAYALKHGISFSDLVAEALRKVLTRRSA